MGDIEPELLAMMQARKGMMGGDVQKNAAAAAEAREVVDNSALLTNPEDIKTRDEDGTVDRVRDPPPEMWPVLASIREKCKVERVDIISVFTVSHPPHWNSC